MAGDRFAIFLAFFVTKAETKTGALNLQGIEFARKGGGNCEERNIQGKAPQFASVWICKEWIYPGNQHVESARNSICKERNLQGTELARKSRQYLACYICICHVRVQVVFVVKDCSKSRGKLYVCENQLYIQHSIKTGVRYLKCINEDCMAMIINLHTPCVKNKPLLFFEWLR